jgi:DNA-binding LytR/AlgR family response regulator
LGDYIKINLRAKNFVTRETISSIKAKLPKNKFIRTHRSFIVSTRHLTSFINEYIEIKEEAIPISRSYRITVLNKLENG